MAPVTGSDVLDGAGRPLDRIVLSGIAAIGRHGVFDHERRDGQRFEVDVVLHVDTRAAAAGDDLSRTVDYGQLAVAVGEVIRGEPVQLIETLAARVAGVCLGQRRVIAVDVAVHKPQAPVAEQVRDIMVAIRRYRDERTDLGPSGAGAGPLGGGPTGPGGAVPS